MRTWEQFPNPFGSTLCVPHVMFLTVVGAWHLLHIALMCVLQQYLLNWHHSATKQLVLELKRRKEAARYDAHKQDRRDAGEVAMLTSEHCFDQIKSAFIEFTPLDDTSITQVLFFHDFHEWRKNAVIKTLKSDVILAGRVSFACELYTDIYAWIHACLCVASLVGALMKYAHWLRTDALNANANGWQKYEGLGFALLYNCGLSTGGLVKHYALNYLFIDAENSPNATLHNSSAHTDRHINVYVLQYGDPMEKNGTYLLKYFHGAKAAFVAHFLVFAICLPFVATHLIPHGTVFQFTFIPIILVCLLIGALVAIGTFFAVDCPLLRVGDSRRIGQNVLETVVIPIVLFAIGCYLDFAFGISVVMMSDFYSTHGSNWTGVYKRAFSGGYCKNHSVFAVGQFSWIEWVVVIGWLL